MMNRRIERFKTLRIRAITTVFLLLVIGILSYYKVLWLLFIGFLGMGIACFETPQLFRTHIFLKNMLYPGIPTLLLLLHAWQSQSWILMMQPFILAWSGDTAAYFVGNLVGSHHPCPSMSPQKTTEGLFGGILITIFLYYFLFEITVLAALIQGTIAAFAAFAGDIFVSWLKRSADAKDTGKILPGHGGLLDRMDSVYGIIGILVFFLLFETL
jgi:phosphatidate cytidylyltransferase